MNQEAIMKRRMYIAVTISILAVLVMLLFMGLYIDEKRKTQRAYRVQYMENLQWAYEEMDTYLEKKTDYQLHYNMVLSDMGAARAMLFLLEDSTETQKNAINALYFCFVKYPEQMSERLPETSEALKTVTANLEKGYDAVQEIVDGINKKGT